jgi:CII-binding regulator of phage lambda lysogenization HflD
MSTEAAATGIVESIKDYVQRACKAHVAELELRIMRRLVIIGDPTAGLEALGTKVGELHKSNESVRQVIEERDLRGSQNNPLADDENIKSMKHQLSRHAEHLRALQDRVRKLENER